jgi:hypothetical protein
MNKPVMSNSKKIWTCTDEKDVIVDCRNRTRIVCESSYCNKIANRKGSSCSVINLLSVISSQLPLRVSCGGNVLIHSLHQCAIINRSDLWYRTHIVSQVEVCVVNNEPALFSLSL